MPSPTRYSKGPNLRPFEFYSFPFKAPIVERVAGIEPASSAWKAEVLPLNHTRVPFSKSANRPEASLFAYNESNNLKPLRMQLMVVGEGFEPSKA